MVAWPARDNSPVSRSSFARLGVSADFVGKGYAAVVTNAGHDPASAPKWALGQPEKVTDFGHRANHLGAAFGKALRDERACQQREEGICTIDSDPWLDAQDGEIDSPVRYSWKQASATAGSDRPGSR
mgnify:CR=1 FL=1